MNSDYGVLGGPPRPSDQCPNPWRGIPPINAGAAYQKSGKNIPQTIANSLRSIKTTPTTGSYPCPLVLFRYERTISFAPYGRRPPGETHELAQGFSSGHYEDGALVVTTTNFVFDIVGFDDYNGIPSSSQKIVRERYWRDGDDLWITLEVEDPMFLEEPTSYTARWIPASEGYKLLPYDCDPEASRGAVRFFPSRYD